MRLVAPWVDATPLPAVKLKGKEQEVKVYNVLGLRGARDDWRNERTRPG